MNATTGQFLLAVHRAARRMPHVEFRPWLFRELGSVLRFDSGLWLRIAISDDGPRMHDHHLDRQRPDRISSYLEQGLWREDPQKGWVATVRYSTGARAYMETIPADRLRELPDKK